MKRHNHCLLVCKFLLIENIAHYSVNFWSTATYSAKRTVSSLRFHNDNEKATSQIIMPYIITYSLADILCQSSLSHLFYTRISKMHTVHAKGSWRNSIQRFWEYVHYTDFQCSSNMLWRKQRFHVYQTTVCLCVKLAAGPEKRVNGAGSDERMQRKVYSITFRLSSVSGSLF